MVVRILTGVLSEIPSESNIETSMVSTPIKPVIEEHKDDQEAENKEVKEKKLDDNKEASEENIPLYSPHMKASPLARNPLKRARESPK